MNAITTHVSGAAYHCFVEADSLGLSPSGETVYKLILHRAANGRHLVPITRAQIGKQLGLSTSSVSRAYRSLQDRQLIIVSHTRKDRRQGGNLIMPTFGQGL